MIDFVRVIFPIGQGGLAFEKIGGCSIVFDCGSTTSPVRVSKYINWIQSQTSRVNRLYISHFDKDHVNSIRELLTAVTVEKAIMPCIPSEYRLVYDKFTGGAYENTRRLFSDRQIELLEIEGEDTFLCDVIWEWIAKPMLNKSDWPLLKNELSVQKIDVKKLTDPEYIEPIKDKINNCFKTVFKSGGPNSKGLIMLSQKNKGKIVSNILKQNGKVLLHNDDTATLYLGDAHVKGKDAKTVRTFLDSHHPGELLLVQIPHHGSNLNSGKHFDVDFPACFYFYHDISSSRLQKNTSLYAALRSQNKLLEVRDLDSDLIEHKVVIG